MQNALEAAGPNANVWVTIRPHGADNLMLAVRDNGPGVAEELRAQLFEPYVTTRKQGTGLGLAIVKKIIEEHGGILRLSDAECFKDPRICGAKVVIDLPLSVEHQDIKANEGTT